MRWHRLAACLPNAALALFADDAYVSDYHLALLGLPQTTFFHQPYPDSKASLLYALTDKAVLGAVNPKDGAIVWRQALSDSYNGTGALLVAGEGKDVVVSALGRNVASWGARDGRLVWSKSSDDGAEVLDIEIVETQHVKAEDAGKDVIVLYKHDSPVVQRLDGSTGNVRWSYRDKSGDVPIQVSTSTDSAYLVSLHGGLAGGLKAKVTSLNIHTGQMQESYTLESASDVSSPEQILYVGAHPASAVIAWTDKAKKHLKINAIGNKNLHSLAIDNVSGNAIQRVSIHAPQHSAAVTHFLAHYETATEHWAEVYHVDSKFGSVSKAYTLPKLAGQGAFTCSAVDGSVFFTRITTSEIIVVSSVSHGVVARWSLTKPIESVSRGLIYPVQVAAEVVAASATSYPVRAAVVSSVGGWSLIRNGDVSWSRPEYLTGASSATFVDRATEPSLARELEVEDHQNFVASYIHRWRRHVATLQTIPSTLKSWLTSTMEDGKNSFGFKKLAVVALDTQRLAAIDTVSGKPVWTSEKIEFDNGDKWEAPSLRATSRGTVEVRQKNDRATLVFNATDGILLARNEQGIAGLAPADRDGTFYERNEASIRAFSPSNPSTSLWQHGVPSGQRIVTVAARPLHDPVASIGKVLGDRRVLYKYLNPNLAVVGTVSDEASTLHIDLLDTVSGRTLYSTCHSGVDTRRAVVSAISENWFSYSFTLDKSTSDDSRGHIIAIAELYESPLPNDRGPLGSQGNFSSMGRASAPPALPHVISQAFHIPEEITHMAVTQTRQGTTSRALLATLAESKGIISIPRQVLDARRPVGRDATAHEAAEGLVRYTPNLEFDAKWVLNHKREVLGIKDVVATPSALESTSLVFAYGLDVFGTRVSPSFTFDVLGKGFNKASMSMTVAALGVAVVLVAPFVQRKQINQRWQT